VTSCLPCHADIAAGVMGAQAVDAGLPLMEQGLDSLAAVELRNGAAAAFGVPLGAAVALDHPTLEVVCWLTAFACGVHGGVIDELQHVLLGRPAIDWYTSLV
jgi:Phosphopantetheine attachment site